jgi:DNA-binding transcriptional regulator YiaG
MARTFSLLILCLALGACGDSGKPKQSAGDSKPVRMACRTIDEAAMKAQDITRKLAEARKQGTITQDEYTAYTNTVSDGLSAWAERQDLKAYCAALQRVVTDAGFQ